MSVTSGRGRWARLTKLGPPTKDRWFNNRCDATSTFSFENKNKKRGRNKSGRESAVQQCATFSIVHRRACRYLAADEITNETGGLLLFFRKKFDIVKTWLDLSLSFSIQFWIFCLTSRFSSSSWFLKMSGSQFVFGLLLSFSFLTKDDFLFLFSLLSFPVFSFHRRKLSPDSFFF